MFVFLRRRPTCHIRETFNKRLGHVGWRRTSRGFGGPQLLNPTPTHTHTHTQQFSSPSITGMISPKPCSPKPLNSRPSRPYEHSEPTSLTSESKGLDANQLNLLVKAADRPDAADEAVKDSRFSVHERGLGIRAWCSSMALQQGFKWI